MEIRFGALSDPLHKQLEVLPSIIELEQKLADAIVLCNIHGVLTDTETHKARKRIIKMLDSKI